jgi:transposase
MRAYSLDLRQKVVAAVECGDSTIEEVASSFGVGQTFVNKMLRQHRESGDLNPRPHGGGQTARLSGKHLKLLRAEVARSPDKTAAALRDHLEERVGITVSCPTVTRALSRLGLSRKKNAGGEWAQPLQARLVLAAHGHAQPSAARLPR